jgi:hypothetical protein
MPLLKWCVADDPFSLQEIAMTRLITFLVSVFMLGAAHALEVQDGSFPEPDYVGILMVVVLMVGSSVWIFRQVTRKDKQEEQVKQIDPK